MTARRTILRLEELDQRVLPSTSTLNQGIIGQLTSSAVTQSVFVAVSALGGANPGGPASRNLPFLAEGSIVLEPPISIFGPGHVMSQQLVIHNAEELLAATGMTTAQLAARLNVSHIDWHTQMIVLVSEGVNFFDGKSPSVDITGLHIGHGGLTVQWHFEQPNPKQSFTGVINIGQPAEVVLTTKFTGPATFHQNPTVVLPPPGTLFDQGPLSTGPA
jgi:hypothetical protein